jgi:hypothetical protein
VQPKRARRRATECTYTTKHGTVAKMKTGAIGKPGTARANPESSAEFHWKYPHCAARGSELASDNGAQACCACRL